MKLKGINPIEQHVEKIVLGVVALVFVGVLAVQFLLSPNSVDYEGQKVPPQEVLTRLGTRADATLSQMNDTDPALPEVSTPDLAARYNQAVGSAGFDAPRVAAAPLGDSFELEMTRVEMDGPVAQLRLPEPVSPMAASQWTTVDPFFARSTPALNGVLPESQPMDTATVTIEASINGQMIREALESADGDRRPIPSHWWSEAGEGLVEVLGVSVERQQQNADGTWGAPEPVDGVRWTPSVLEEYSNRGNDDEEALNWDDEDLRASDLLGMARMAQSDPSLVAQPWYLPSISGVEWVPPSKVEQRQARLDLESRIGRIEREIANLEEDIAQIEERRSGRPSRPQTTRGNNPNTFRIGNPGAGGNQRQTNTNRPDPSERQIASKQEQIDERVAELDELTIELEELGGTPAANTSRRTARRQPGQNPGGARTPQLQMTGGGSPTLSSPRQSGTRARARTRTAESPGPLLSLESYPVWVHDLRAEPGATYRYRVRYSVNNPLFKRSVGTEDEELQAVAAEPLVSSDWSGWTEPVTVGRTSYFFVTNARQQDQLGSSTEAATAEIYRMFYGYYRKHTLTLEPGDAVQGEFRLPENLPLFDVASVTGDELEAYFQEREEAEEGPTAQGGRLPGAADDEEEEAPVERDWLTLVEPRYPLAVDAVMLDVAEYPIALESGIAGGQARQVLEVMFYDPISGVVSRRPDRDREMAEYAAVEQSAGLAVTSSVRRPDPEYVP